ncbi:MAG: hypothetical protein WCP69_11655 [Bacteroidota bacterium]
MKYIHYLIGVSCLLFVLAGCKKDDQESVPTISIKSGGIYSSNGSFLTNHKAKLGIVADGGGANITNLVIKITKNGTSSILSDEGYNSPTLDIIKILQLSQGDSLTWDISVMNKDRKSASITFFTRDTTLSYGEIWSYSNLRIGMQNSTLGSYLDPFSGTVYTAQSAVGNESNIHILGYYYISSGIPSYTFASAGDQDAPTYLPAMSGWSVKNYTDWDYVTVVSTASFDAANNDSLLVASFHSGAGISSRKYKWADVDKVIPFKTTNNKTGLIKVNSISAAEAGYIDFNLKIQK